MVHFLKELNILEREGAAYGGYGGMYVHEYGGPMNPTSLPQERRSSRGSQISDTGRLSRHEDIDEDMVVPYSSMGYGPPQPSESAHYPYIYRRDGYDSSDVQRRSSLKKTTQTSTQSSRNVYTPLNNESRVTRAGTPITRKPADLTIINNTVAASQPTYKNVNAHANLSATSSLVEAIPPHQQYNALRRGSEPPRAFIGRSDNIRNRSFDDLGDVEQPYELFDSRDSRSSGSRASSRRDDDRESARTISRAHLRRDSFGEVVSSRRSPSQDSLDNSRTRSSPEIEEGDSCHRPGNIVWKRSPSQDSLPRQVSGFINSILVLSIYCTLYHRHISFALLL